MTERRGVLLGVLLFTMTASSFQLFALAVLAVDFIEDLELSRTGLGLLGSLNTMVGALSAPTMGRVTDRIGARRSVMVALVVSAVGMALTAASGHWVMLAGAAVVSGLPQGWGNPATNALISERVPSNRQGTVTGVKQSGVQFGIFLSGLTLPGLALLVGWRGALWGYAAFFLVGAVLVGNVLGPPPTDENQPPTAQLTTSENGGAAASEPNPVPRFIWVLSLYAFLFGAAGGAIGRFYALWAHEVIGLSTVVAGALVAFGGLLAIGTRIVAGQVAQRRIAPPRLLGILAGFGAFYALILTATGTIGAWILWPATVIYAIGIGAWNTVAMLAVITTMPRAAAGRASGVVMLGFLGGISVSAPVAGLVVDRWDSYQPVWVGAMALSVVSAIVIRPGVLTDRTAPGSDHATPRGGTI